VVVNELAELYEHRCARDGSRAAAAWYRRQVRQYPVRLLADRLSGGARRHSAPTDPRRRRRLAEAMAQLLRDIGHSARGLIKTPAMSLTIVVTVGLGIGGTAAMFSAVHAVLLKPLPYSDPERLVAISTDSPPNRWPLSAVDYQAIEEQQTAFESVAAFQRRIVTFNQDEVAERIWVRFVTPSYFSLLGVDPLYGRTFVPADAETGTTPTAVLAYSFWRERLGADPGVLGRSIRLDGNDFRIIGVLPPETGPLEARRAVFPILQLQPPERRGPFFFTALGRLRPDTNLAAANHELRAISKRIFPLWQSSYADATTTFAARSLHDEIVGDSGTDLAILLGAVTFVLLIVTMNATNLLLARGIQRRQEMAIRAALGASRGRLLQVMLCESLLLAFTGAVMGIALTAVAVKVMATAGATLIPRAEEISFSGTVLWFTIAVTLGSGLLFGLAPSLRVIRVRLQEALQTSSRTASGGLHNQRLRRLIVALQLAVAVPLLVGAGLLLTSYLRLRGVDPGINRDNLLTMRISLPRTAYPDPHAVEAFWEQATARVRALPGVVEVGQGTGRPPQGVGMENNFNMEDDPTPADQAEPVVPWPVVSPGYFQTLGIPLLQGRRFDEGDRDGGEPVAIVDQAWVRRFSPAQDPIGRRFYSGGCNRPECPLTTVVGVVGDVSYKGLDAPPQGTIYEPLLQNTWWSRNLFVRTGGDPLLLVPEIRTIVRQIDATVPLAEIATMEELMQEALATPRGLLGLIAAFAAIALLLATIGIYGVMSFFVQQHTRDIGIRIALGGSSLAVSRLVIARGMRMVVLGVVLGIAGALVLTRYLTSMLYQVSANDSATYVTVTALLTVTAFLACLLPAQRAARLDPVTTLRNE
jgi:predicted permease